MKRIARILVIGASMALAAGGAAAQNAQGLLNSLEVKRLVSEGTPAANATLAGHFTALADKYTAEAAAHTAMATAYGGNPNHSIAGSMGPHCRKLADLATASAKTAREMVTYYDKLAAGASAEVPKGASAFQGGAGAPAPTAADLKRMAPGAHMPSDHHALQEYFLTLARQKTAEANEHTAMAS